MPADLQPAVGLPSFLYPSGSQLQSRTDILCLAPDHADQDEQVQDFKARGIDFSDIDGLRYQDEHGWWLIRASNTQPALVGRCESLTPEGLKALKQNLDENLSKHFQG